MKNKRDSLGCTVGCAALVFVMLVIIIILLAIPVVVDWYLDYIKLVVN